MGGWFGVNFPSTFLKILKFQIFQKSRRWFIPKLPEPNMWLLAHYTKATNTLCWNQYLLTADNYKSVSRHLQNDTVNGAMSITMNSASIKNSPICMKLPFPISFIMGMAKLLKMRNNYQLFTNLFLLRIIVDAPKMEWLSK